jgi:hypothetical protein
MRRLTLRFLLIWKRRLDIASFFLASRFSLTKGQLWHRFAVILGGHSISVTAT